MTAIAHDDIEAEGDPARPGGVAPTAQRHLRRNLALIVGEALCFATGYALFDSSTVLASPRSDEDSRVGESMARSGAGFSGVRSAGR